MEIFEEKKLLKICAPMVRYSKLPFRTLARKYGCDLVFTPMILSDSFVKSQKARDNEFTTNDGDKPLIVQFAANNAEDFASAAELVAPYCNGVDLNCGCPQRWALKEGIGACLINKPNLVRDVVLQTRNRISCNDFSISIKIRIHNDIQKTVDFTRQIEAAGISFLTVHGRTVQQRKEPVSLAGIRTLRESLHIPLVANGDVKTLEGAYRIQEETGVNGVMAANGMLQNPAMFAGYNFTPVECIADWIDIAMETGTPFTCFHHHLIFMCEKSMSKAERKVFNVLSSTSAVINFLKDHYLLGT